MVTTIDRVQVTARNAAQTAERWIGLLGGRAVGEDRLQSLNARRVTVAVGDSHVEVLEPLGPGPAEAHLGTGRGGPFAAGIAVEDVEETARRLRAAGVEFAQEGEQLFLDDSQLGLAGLRIAISPRASRPNEGVLDTLYEVTHLTADPGAAGRRLADLLHLDPSHFVPIESDAYGYRGTLTLFDPDHLDRIETIAPFDVTKTMGRYFERFGPSLYMCFAECADLARLRETLSGQAPDDWTGPREGPVDSLFIHPRALGGVMLGVSRTSFAWSWSGSPERVLASA